MKFTTKILEVSLSRISGFSALRRGGLRHSVYSFIYLFIYLFAFLFLGAMALRHPVYFIFIFIFIFILFLF